MRPPAVTHARRVASEIRNAVRPEHDEPHDHEDNQLERADVEHDVSLGTHPLSRA